MCKKKFRDEECANEITDIDISVAAKHTATSKEPIVPTCTTAGTIAHYECRVCKKKFRDEECTDEITDIDISVAAKHTATSKVATDPTCTTAGTIAHYECSVCKKTFTDEECTDEITDITDKAKPATGHTYNSYVKIDASTHKRIASCGISDHNIIENHDFSNDNCPCGQASPLKLTKNGTGSTGDTHTLTGFDNTLGVKQLNIPESVTRIENEAFKGNTDLTSVTIPDSVTTIGNYAFSNCHNLTSVTISNSVTAINLRAFEYCDNLTSVTIPDSVKEIVSYAFIGCSKLTDITIPDGVTSIAYSAFENCSSLERITIPKSVTSIGGRAFADCSNLTEIIWNAKSASYFNSSDIYAFSRAGTAGNGIKVIFGDDVTSIPKYLFQSDDLSSSPKIASIKIGKNVTSIGDYALAAYVGNASITVDSENTKYHIAGNCLIEIATKTLIAGNNNSIIPTDGSVTKICSEAFKGCSGLKSITIPESVKSIGSWRTFQDCSGLESVIIQTGVTSIVWEAFKGCSKLTSITIPSSVTSIGSSAFSGCSKLTRIYYTGNIASWCGIKDLNNLMSYDVTDRKLYINGTEITGELVIPEGVVTIPSYAFKNCSSLTSIIIPNGVTSIESYAFKNCSSLTSIRFQGTKAQWNAIRIGSNWNASTGNYTIHCDDGDIAK